MKDEVKAPTPTGFTEIVAMIRHYFIYVERGSC
jgi:hypothetical protein